MCYIGFSKGTFVSRTPWPQVVIFSAEPEEGDGFLGLDDYGQDLADVGLVDLRLAGMYWCAVGLKVSSVLWSGTSSGMLRTATP